MKCRYCLTNPVAYGATRVAFGDTVPICSECAVEHMDKGFFTSLVDALAVWDLEEYVERFAS